MKTKSFGKEERLKRISLIILLIFLALTALGGGSARTDVPSLLFLRPMAVLAIVGFLLTSPRLQFGPLRTPLLLLVAFGVVIALQLLPLPPKVWQVLPGHARFVSAATLAGIPQPWRPISLQPDLTINSLLALLSPLAVLVGFSAVSKSQRHILVGALVVIIAVSTFWGIFEITGIGSGLQLYRLSSPGQPLGLFANRNHQAALISTGFPILRLWVLLGPSINSAEPRGRILAYIRLLGASTLALVLLPVLLLAGSRMGLLLGAMGLVGAALIAPVQLPVIRGKNGPWIKVGVLIVPVVLLAAMVLFGRAVALDRLFASDLIGGEQRVIFAPITFAIALAFLPFGSGMGTFEAVFRIYEPDSILKPTVFNHAHNDLVELLLTGGVPAVALFGGLMIWLGMRLPGLCRRPQSGRRADRWSARAGAIVIAILLVASITDYPLRTPLLAAIFGLMVCWIASDRPASAASGTGV